MFDILFKKGKKSYLPSAEGGHVFSNPTPLWKWKWKSDSLRLHGLYRLYI